jgi:hypothetical protein
MVSRGRSTDLGGVGRVRKTKASKASNKVRCAKIHGRHGHADRFYLEGEGLPPGPGAAAASGAAANL